MRSRLATLAILVMTATWGSTFFLTKDLLTRVGVTDYLGIRFVIATVAMVLTSNRTLFRLTRRDVYRGAVLGIIFGVSQLLQTAGLTSVSASTSGFITGIYVVLTPLIGAVLFRQRIGRWVWMAVVLATIGLGIISLRGIAMGTGELLTLACAMGYTLHILGIGRWSTERIALPLATVQLAASTVICLIAASWNGIVMPNRGGDWAAIVYMALLAGALAMLLQTWAQARLSPTRAAVIMTTEPLFATLFAILFGSEHLTARLAIGGLLVLAAMYLVELAPCDRDSEGMKEEVVLVPEIGMAGTVVPEPVASGGRAAFAAQASGSEKGSDEGLGDRSSFPS